MSEANATQLRLGSSAVVYGPGLFRWCQAAYRSGDAAVAVRVLSQTYQLKTDLAEALLCGRIPASVEGEDVCFEVPDDLSVPEAAQT